MQELLLYLEDKFEVKLVISRHQRSFNGSVRISGVLKSEFLPCGAGSLCLRYDVYSHLP